MTIDAIRRKMKNSVEQSSKKGKKVSLSKVAFFSLVISISSFFLVHLVVSSVLDPRGKELRMLDNQKENLIEENRILEQEIAKLSSLSVVVGRAEKELGMDRADDVIYISAPSASANMEPTSK